MLAQQELEDELMLSALHPWGYLPCLRLHICLVSNAGVDPWGCPWLSFAFFTVDLGVKSGGIEDGTVSKVVSSGDRFPATP